MQLEDHVDAGSRRWSLVAWPAEIRSSPGRSTCSESPAGDDEVSGDPRADPISGWRSSRCVLGTAPQTRRPFDSGGSRNLPCLMIRAVGPENALPITLRSRDEVSREPDVVRGERAEPGALSGWRTRVLHSPEGVLFVRLRTTRLPSGPGVTLARYSFGGLYPFLVGWPSSMLCP